MSCSSPRARASARALLCPSTCQGELVISLRLLLSISLALVAVARPATSQHFYFISSRGTSGTGPLVFDIYEYEDGDETRVAKTDVIEEHPVSSPLNDALFFVRPGPSGHKEIYRSNLTGGALTQVTTDAGSPGIEANHHVFPHPNEGSLFVSTALSNGSEVIREVSLSGTPLQTVVDHGAGVHVGHSPAQTTPSGDFLYYASDLDGDFELYRAELDGSNEQKLTSNAIYDSGASVKPDGQLVAFTRESIDPCVTQIWVMSHDGTGQTQVTSEPLGFKWSLGWDGDDILYVSNETGDQRIYSIATDGSGKTLLVNSVGDDMHLLPDPTCGFNLPEVHVEGPKKTDTGVSVEFTADHEGPAFDKYIWNFGDGHTLDTGSSPTATHVYETVDTYQVSVRARDNCTPPNESIGTLPELEVADAHAGTSRACSAPPLPGGGELTTLCGRVIRADPGLLEAIGGWRLGDFAQLKLRTSEVEDSEISMCVRDSRPTGTIDSISGESSVSWSAVGYLPTFAIGAYGIPVNANFDISLSGSRPTGNHPGIGDGTINGAINLDLHLGGGEYSVLVQIETLGQPCVSDIPALPVWGPWLLGLLMLSSAGFLVRRR